MSKISKDKGLLELNKRLGVIISLLLKMIPADGGGLSLREQIKILGDLGIGPTETAAILGRTPSYVSKELTIIKQKDAKKNTQIQ